MSCGKCLQSARFLGYRSKSIVSLLGPIRFSRAYYHCKSCPHGQVPWDEELGLPHGDLTPAAEEVVSLAGITDSFDKAANRLLVKLSGIRLSESTVENTTEAAGKRLGEVLEQEKVLGESAPWKWNKDATGQTVAYVSVDATGVPMQGKKSSKAEGRMAYVGMIYNPIPEGPPAAGERRPEGQARYLAGFYDLEKLGPQLRRQAGQVGMDNADQWVALTDGGSGLEPFLDVNFPRAQKILDFWHASEHLGDLAKALCPHDDEQARKHQTTWCHQLKHEGGEKLLETLTAIDVSNRSAEAKEQYRLETNYLRNNVHRTNYPEYVRRGWQIGSGPIESACKMVVNQRLKMGGMRWGTAGADSVCHLRALFRSEPAQWDAFWARSLN